MMGGKGDRETKEFWNADFGIRLPAGRQGMRSVEHYPNSQSIEHSAKNIDQFFTFQRQVLVIN
jgi:hypothetical protein